jgi:hypothetical protein
MKKLYALAALILSLVVPGALAADTIDVRLGNSQVIGPLDHMATVIVGNDGVVGTALGGGGIIILTGKKLGATNLIVLDESGRELLSSDLNVVPQDNRPTTTVRISRGISKSGTYVCGAGAGCTPGGGALASVAAPDEETPDGAPSEETPEATPETNPEAPEASPETDTPASEEMISLNP